MSSIRAKGFSFVGSLTPPIGMVFYSSCNKMKSHAPRMNIAIIFTGIKLIVLDGSDDLFINLLVTLKH